VPLQLGDTSIAVIDTSLLQANKVNRKRV